MGRPKKIKAPSFREVESQAHELANEIIEDIVHIYGLGILNARMTRDIEKAITSTGIYHIKVEEQNHVVCARLNAIAFSKTRKLESVAYRIDVTEFIGKGKNAEEKYKAIYTTASFGEGKQVSDLVHEMYRDVALAAYNSIEDAHFM